MKKTLGFTSIELVIVMLLLGVTSIFVLSFIGMGTQIFVQASSRAEVSMYAKNLLQRMKREIINAVPYSLSTKDYVTSNYLEFISPVANSRIIKINYDSNDVANSYLILATDIVDKLDSVSCNETTTKWLYTIVNGQISKYELKEQAKYPQSAEDTKGTKISFKDNTNILSIKQSLSTNNSRVYFIDDCSVKRYSFSKSNKILDYQQGSISNGVFTSYQSAPLSDNKIKVESVLFNIASDNNNYQTQDTSNRNDVIVGILLSSGGEIISISQFLEVLNAS